MKILLFWSYYDHYIQQLYEKSTHLAELSYSQQLDTVLEDNFGWPPALVNRLVQMGHTVEILIVNAKLLQQTWARENGYEFSIQNWQYTIPLEQVKRFSPDVVWIGSMFNYFGDYLGQLKQYCKKIFAWIACPITKSLDLSHIDCMLTSHTNYQSYFQVRGKAAEILLPCFEQDILATATRESRDVECSFIGALSWAHIARIDTIKQLADEAPIQIWSDHPKLLSRGILKPKFWNAYLKLRTIKSRMNTSVWGMNMYEILARSKITINVHAEVASGLAGNMRMFEATGMGALLITEDAPNIRELYEPGTEVITYKSTENLVELINYYLSHPQERESIAQAGQARTLKDHSTVQRSKELIELFTRYLGQ
jgi:spore maturation protein CgeB